MANQSRPNGREGRGAVHMRVKILRKAARAEQPSSAKFFCARGLHGVWDSCDRVPCIEVGFLSCHVAGWLPSARSMSHHENPTMVWVVSAKRASTRPRPSGCGTASCSTPRETLRLCELRGPRPCNRPSVQFGLHTCQFRANRTDKVLVGRKFGREATMAAVEVGMQTAGFGAIYRAASQPLVRVLCVDKLTEPVDNSDCAHAHTFSQTT